MKDYIITLTDTEVKSLEYVAYDNQEWIENAVKNRVRIAKNEIISLNTSYCNNNNIAIAIGYDAQIEQAYSLGVVKTAKEITKEKQKDLSKIDNQIKLNN